MTQQQHGFSTSWICRRPGKYHDRLQITQLRIRPHFLLLETEQAVSEEATNKGQSIFNAPAVRGEGDSMC